jgi:predicted ATPase with chaperone activity
MLARRLATLLPAMRLAAALETTRIHNVAGLTSGRTAVVPTRPFRAPHHTIADVGVIGGGQRPLPGEVSLAHHGLLFLDELPEFTGLVFEILRQSIEKDVLCRQSREHHKSEYFCALRSPRDDRQGVGQGPVVAHPDCGASDAGGITLSLLRSSVCRRLVIFA